MAKEEVKVPSVGESVTEVTLGRLIAEEGSFVNEDSPLCELESDKASVEVPAPVSGVISYTKKEGDVISVGDTFAVIDTEAKAKEPSQEPKKEEVKEEPKKAPAPKKEEAPVSIQGGIRESLDDHIKKVQTEVSTPTNSIEAPKTETPKPVVKEEATTTRTRMPKIRQVIAKRLVQVKNETAMLTTFNEVDMSAVMKIRKTQKDAFLNKHGVKLTFMPFFMKAAATALKEFKDVNAYIDGDEIVYNNHVQMGIAVSTDKGLVVPVIRNIDEMNLAEMTKSMMDLAVKGRDGKLSISDMSGGTFTITNGGVFGSMLSTPILNPPQSAILGLHNIVERPVAVDGKVEIRPIMYLALSYDHRIIDGKESVQFLGRIKELIEDPALFILGD